MKTNYFLKSACALVMFTGSVFAFQAKAADPVQVGGFYYALDDATLTAELVEIPRADIPDPPHIAYNITGALVVPATIENAGKTYAVKKIGTNAFRTEAGITSISLPDGLEVIGNSSFVENTGVSSVVVPATVKTIEGWAFYGCTNLASINIPDGIELIDEHLFQQTGLTSIVLPASVKSLKVCAFQDASKLASINLENITEIIAWALYGTAITSADIKNVENIGNEAFRFCPNLETVTLEGVKTTGSWTFGGCPKLTSVTLGEGLEEIGGGAFSGCSALKTLTIPNSVFSIEDWALEKTALTSVYVSWANVDSDTGDVIIAENALGQDEGKPYFTWYVPEELMVAYPFNWFGLPVEAEETPGGAGINTVQGTDATAYHADGALHLSNLQGNSATVYAIDGKTVARFQVNSDNAQVPVALPQGVYILKAGKTAIKFIAR
ncbi:hypothetical protein AGMMS49965_18760 [Bacteroidia bacterium]|nr:hypothetical protein AGMMS49965_18760 [Bacteroidia bacterium]